MLKSDDKMLHVMIVTNNNNNVCNDEKICIERRNMVVGIKYNRENIIINGWLSLLQNVKMNMRLKVLENFWGEKVKTNMSCLERFFLKFYQTN